ncbi:TPA: DUF99 family protein [Candidatus Woesearchaeota archaeon]|nr:DUF99 family protein [Candidatus Woesearchaeota archaeon]
MALTTARDNFRDRKILVAGTFFRGGSSLDGVMTTTATVDGSDATAKISGMVKKAFYTQLRAIMLNYIAVGGFNLIDIQRLNHETKIPVGIVMRSPPEAGRMKATLEKRGMRKKAALIEKAGTIEKAGSMYVQLCSCSLQKASELIKISCTRSIIPELIMVAHLIAAGIGLGESRGKA